VFDHVQNDTRRERAVLDVTTRARRGDLRVVRHHVGDAIGCKIADAVYGTIFGTIFGTIPAANTRQRREPVLAHRL
jgi:hypothetical protein